MACLFHLIGVVTKKNGYPNWIDTRGLSDSNTRTRYLSAFYWSAVTTMTVGYGDIIPENVYEIAFVTFSVLFGCGTFAYYINKVGQII